MSYIRIGTDYFKIVQKPQTSGELMKTMIPWTKVTIMDDHGKEYLKSLDKYEGFVTFPSHDSYKQVIDGFYNKYRELSHSIETNIGVEQFPNTLNFLKHIFQEQFILGMDYLTILWRYPLQILPILCLVSDERNTGKTTFLNWLKLLYEDNMTINKNEDFRSRFNSDWSEKLIVAIDEALLDKREDSERIKNLSTASVFKTEAKGKDRVESGFFGKFILCSNHEETFILIDKNEIRYWVIKVKTIPILDSNLHGLLKEEISLFASFLKSREIQTTKKTRMWFTKDQIYTEALDKLVNGTKLYHEKELKSILMEMFEAFQTETICLTFKDIIEELKESKYRIARGDLERVMRMWKLESRNSSYVKYHKALLPGSNEWQIEETNTKGRFYTFRKEHIEKC